MSKKGKKGNKGKMTRKWSRPAPRVEGAPESSYAHRKGDVRPSKTAEILSETTEAGEKDMVHEPPKGLQPAPDLTQRPQHHYGLTPRWWLALGLILAFVGVNLQLLTHIVPVRWFGLCLIVGGLVNAFYWVFHGAHPRSLPREKPGKRKDLAWKFIYNLTFKGRLISWFPLLGFVVIMIDVVWNLIIAGSTEFLSQDWTMWAFGVVLMAYIFIPIKYGKERDFSFILIFIYSFTMVLPMGLWRIYTGTLELPGGFVYWLLGSPVAAVVSLTGTQCNAHEQWVTFQMTNGFTESLGISTGCAGLDSLFLFIAGFVAFVLVENPRMDRRIGGALVVGILTAYFANILRMVIIVLAGVNWGRDAMLATHENAGTLIFLGWIAIFWYLMYRFVLRRGPKPTYETIASRAEAETEPEVLPDAPMECARCGQEIDPDDVPEKCPTCGQAFDTNLYCEKCGTVIDPSDIPDKCPKCGNMFDV
jgi:exosortase/archaeosortase family protein